MDSHKFIKDNTKIIYIYYQKESIEFSYNSKISLTNIKTYCGNKLKIKVPIENLKIYAYNQNKYLIVENDSKLIQLIINNNINEFILLINKFDYIEKIDDLEKKYQIFDKKSNYLIDQFNKLIKKENEQEKKITQLETKINELFSLINIKKPKNDFSLLDQSKLMSVRNILEYSFENKIEDQEKEINKEEENKKLKYRKIINKYNNDNNEKIEIKNEDKKYNNNNNKELKKINNENKSIDYNNINNNNNNIKNNNNYNLKEKNNNSFNNNINKEKNVQTPKGNNNNNYKCQITFNKSKIPIILKSHLYKTIHLKIEIENICDYDIPKHCQLITRDDKYNILILNPNINDNEVIKVKEKKYIQLDFKFKDNYKIDSNKIHLEFALHSELFGLISKWERISLLIKDDNENIEKI